MVQKVLVYVFVLSLVACNIASSANPAENLVDVKMLRFYASFKPGCGNNLSPKGLSLQDKGMKLIISDMLSTGHDFSYQYWTGGNKDRDEAIVTLIRALESEPRLLPAYFVLMDYFSGQHGMGRTYDFVQRYKFSMDQVDPTDLYGAMKKSCQGYEGTPPRDYLWLTGSYRQAVQDQRMCNARVIQEQIDEATQKIKDSASDLSAFESLALWSILKGDFEAARQAVSHLKEMDADGKLKSFTDKVLADLERPEIITWCNEQTKSATDQRVNRIFAEMLAEYNGDGPKIRHEEDLQKKQ